MPVRMGHFPCDHAIIYQTGTITAKEGQIVLLVEVGGERTHKLELMNKL